MRDLTEAIKELRTLLDVIRWGMTQFEAADLYYGHGTENAWDEAVFLAHEVLHLPLDMPTLIHDARLTLKEREAIMVLYAKRIAERIPAPYLVNRAYFAGLPFYVDPYVLIPRSPIAELIHKGFEPWIDSDNVHRVLDLCTGSACIAIACAHAFEDAEVVAGDISDEALAIAQRNAEALGVSGRLNLLKSDLYENIPKQPYDIIVSNPPYVNAEELESLPPEYHHEPRLGLAAGEDGLLLIERILKESADYLSPEGILVLEVGTAETALIERYPDLPCIWLDFERGGEGVLLLTAAQLREWSAVS